MKLVTCCNFNILISSLFSSCSNKMSYINFHFSPKHVPNSIRIGPLLPIAPLKWFSKIKSKLCIYMATKLIEATEWDYRLSLIDVFSKKCYSYTLRQYFVYQLYINYMTYAYFFINLLKKVILSLCGVGYYIVGLDRL